MKAAAHAANQLRSQEGFTLVETLIALMIFAISAGLSVQSVALATGQIRTFALAASAELLAISLLAERATSAGSDTEAEGTDPASGLFWRYVRKGQPRVADEGKLASASTVFIQVRAAKDAGPIYELRSVSMEAGVQ